MLLPKIPGGRLNQPRVKPSAALLPLAAPDTRCDFHRRRPGAVADARAYDSF
jgi:hypothetical protein